MRYRIVLWLDANSIEEHYIDVVNTQSNYYQITTSINAFKNRESNRLYKVNCSGKFDIIGKRCAVRTPSDYEYAVFTEKPMPQFNHNSIWDFYKSIGYDYKKQKYIK